MCKHKHDWEYVKGTPMFQCKKCNAIATPTYPIVKNGSKIRLDIL